MNTLVIDSRYIYNGRINEGAFAQDESLASVIIPEGVTDVGELAFYGCPYLREVSFPSTLKYIREEAFGESGIVSAMLPPGLELIAEKAFFSCEALSRIEVPGAGTVIETDAFGCCDRLKEGFIACGYPTGIKHHEELLYTLLWCSCPGRHSEETAGRAAAFITKYENLVMEWIIRCNNVPAMTGLAASGLIRGDTGPYITHSSQSGTSEITALLMTVRNACSEGEFDL